MRFETNVLGAQNHDSWFLDKAKAKSTEKLKVGKNKRELLLEVRSSASPQGHTGTAGQHREALNLGACQFQSVGKRSFCYSRADY